MRSVLIPTLVLFVSIAALIGSDSASADRAVPVNTYAACKASLPSCGGCGRCDTIIPSDCCKTGSGTWVPCGATHCPPCPRGCY